VDRVLTITAVEEEQTTRESLAYWLTRPDLDLFIRPDEAHIRRMLEALAVFGFSAAALEPEYPLARPQMR